MQLQNILKRYTDSKDMPEAKFAGAEGYRLQLKNNDLHFVPLAGNQVAIYSLLPVADELRKTNLAQILLIQGGLMRKRRETVSLDQKSGKLILQRVLPLVSLTPLHFDQVIGEFLASLELWHNYANYGK